MPKYKVNGRTFNIPDNEVDLFEADFPEAQLHYQTNDGRKFTIYANERKDFLSDFPDATELGWGETIKEQAKQTDPFQPEDSLEQPMFGSMSYQDNIGKPEDSLYYPSPLNEEGRAEAEPITAEERSKQEYDMLMRQLNDFDAQNGEFMDTYEAYEKAAKHQVNEGGFALDTLEREYVSANSNDYHLRKQERDALNDRIKNNSYFNQMRMSEADAANETVDAISNLMAQNEAENKELHKRMQAMNALAMNPRGSFSGFAKTKEMQEYMDERADLETAKRLYENTAQVYAAPINDGEDVLKKFGQGFGQRVDDADFWSMGILGIADDMNARAAFQKIQDKFGSVKEFANLTDAEIDALLTPSEQLLISAVMDNNAAMYSRKDNTAGAYEAGSGAADSLMFMAQFLLTGGIGDAATVGTAAHKRLVSWLGRKVGSMSNGLMKDVARGAVKLGVGTAESIGKALVMTPLMPHTYANIADKMMSFDDNGELMDTTDAIISGSIDALIETWSESTGDFVNKILGVPGDITKGVAKKVLKNVDFSDWGKAMNAPMMKILKKGGFNGFLGEMGEEFIGNATRSLVGTLAPGSGQDPEALKNFAQWEQLLVTAGSFAPMTIFGLGTSAAQYGFAKRKLANAQSAFESILRGASYTEDQAKFIIDELLGSTDANLTPEKLVANFSPLLRELAFNDRFANNRTQAMKSAVDFMWEIARYRTFDGVYHRQEEQQRSDMLAEIQEGTGREFWTTRLSENAGLDGTAYETDEVRAVEFNDGRVAYILGSDGTTNTVVYNDGQTGFLSEEQLNEGKTNGSIVSDATMGLNDYLTQQVARVRMTGEEQRMFAERNSNIGQIRAQFPIDATVELGTTEAPIQGVVRQQTPDGVVVESPAGISQLTWEELGHTIGVEVNPQTDAQMEEEAINNLEIADLQRRREREQRRAQRNTAAEAALIEEQMLDEAENEGLEKPIPMKADGTVDQTAFWNESPARWAQWKTEQRQDGGAYASSYIQNAIGILEGQIAESEAAFLAESDFDAKDALEQTINQQKARLAELQDLAMQYMPSVIPTETSAEVTAEQTQPIAETSQPAAVMADRQKFELDAEYQRRLSLAKVLAEKEMILKEYFEAISAGSMEAVVMNKQNYKQIMKEKGCSEDDILEVENTIKRAEENNESVDALHVNDQIFILADYVTSVEKGRVSYVHERQHNITKHNPSLIQRVLSLGLSREQLQKIVRTLAGTDYYDKKSNDVLADEILSSTMEIAYTFDDFSVILSKLGLPIELINLINEINNEQRNDYTLVNARRSQNANNNAQRSSRQNDGNQGEVSGGVLGQEREGTLDNSPRGNQGAGESGESATRGAEASEEGLQVPVAEVDEESEEKPEGPDFRVTKPEDPNGVTAEQNDEINRSVGGELEIEDENTPVRFSVTAIGHGAGLELLKDDGEGNVALVLPDGRKFNAKHLLKPEDLKSLPDSVLSYMMSDARALGNIDARKEWMLWNKYTLMLNAILSKGSAENGGFEHLASQWQWIADTVYKTVATNSDTQYSYSLDITRVCKKNEAVINAIAEMQARLGYGITPGQIMDIYMSTIEEGYQVPCPVCYVFSRYIRNGNYATIMINGQRKYGSKLVDPRTLSEKEKEKLIKYWLKEKERIEAQNEANKGEIEKANADITTLLDEIDKLSKQITDPRSNLTEEQKETILKKIHELDARYKAALNVVSQSSLDSWITQFAIYKKKEGGKERWVLYEDSYMGFPEEMALDLRQTSTVMRLYPAIQRFRKSRGAAAGKEITFVSNNDLGDVALALGSKNATEDLATPRDMSDKEWEELQKKENGALMAGQKNLYQQAYEEKDANKKAELLKKARERFASASEYAKRQSLRGGQRMWSWSDNIERLAPDVFVNLFQMELLGGALQSYSKQLEGIKLVASMNGYVNGSLMGKGNGYAEVSEENVEEVDGKYFLKGGDFVMTQKNGKKSTLRTPVYKHTDGKFYVLEFDDVVGIDAFGKDIDGKHYKGLFELNAEYDKAGNILVGMNDLHIRIAMADDRIFFIIPWHSSGANTHILAQMYDYLGVEYDVTLSQDYTDVQSEKRIKGAGEKEESSKKGKEKKESTPVSIFLAEFWNDHYENAREYEGYGMVAGKDFACGIEGGIASSDGKGNLSEDQMHYRELRDAIFMGVKVQTGTDKKGKPIYKNVNVEEYNEQWFNEIMNDEFLSQVYARVREAMGENGRMASQDTKSIYPYEYWDESSTYATSSINGARYIEYCRRLGYKPKFCGKLDGKPETDFGNFTEDAGYWKTLIDRRMYAVDGSFQGLTPVTAENFTPDLVDPEVTKEEFVVTRVADEAGTQTIVDKAIAKEESRPGGIAKVDYDMTLDQALKAYNNGDVRMRVSTPTGAIDLVEEARKAQAKHDAKEKKGKKSDVSFRITPEQDKAYMDAVKAGDMETAQRMVLEAAKLAMPNTKVVDENGNPKVVYHGTGSEFYTFRETNDSNELGAGYYFSDSYEMAERYATDETLADNRFRAEALAFDIFTDEMGHSEEDYDDNEFIDDYNESYVQAVERLFGNGHVKSVFLNLENPRIMSRNSESFDPTYRYGYNHYNEGAMAKRFNDGIIDEMFEERHEGLTGTQYVAFNPSQIKSADPVTYDNDGKVIPLSERFNPKNEDLRFSIIGERGAMNDKTQEGLARLANLDVARQMESQLNPDWSAKEDENALKIKVATGWERGADGKWRYEVDDIYIKPAKEWLFSKKKLTLKDIVEPNPVFDMYPELLEITIVKDKSKYNLSAWYDESTKQMKLPIGALKDDYTAMMDYYGEEQSDGNFARYWRVMEEDFLHEIQHAIQHREGFARGGSPEMILPEDYEAYKKLYDEMSDLIDTYNSIPYRERNMAYAVSTRNMAQRAKDAVSTFVRRHKLGEERYRRLAGEVESSNVVNRSKLSDHERYNSLLASTEDVARKDQIFLMNSVQTTESSVRFRMSNENQAIFVSNAAKAVEGIKQEKATPEQWLKMIEKNGGLKAGEDKWMGLSDWLKASDKKTLTKQEVLDFINENMIVINEVHYGARAEEAAAEQHALLEQRVNERYKEILDSIQDIEDYDEKRTKAFEQLKDELDEWGDYVDLDMYNVYLTFPYEDLGDYIEMADIFGVEINLGNPIYDIRLNYTTDGLNNKREIALTVPTIESWNESDLTHFGDAGNGRAVAWIRFGETVIPTGEYATLLNEVNRLKEVARELYEEFGGRTNEIAEIEERRVELEYEMRNYENLGKKVLVIDEIQSKRHQEGREKGYTTKEDVAQRKAAIARAKKATNDLYDYIGELVAKYPGTEYSLERVRENRGRFTEEENNKLTLLTMEHNYAELELEKHRGEGVPDAPFEKNWHELAMKRMLRYAAENGYDAIAWTKGDQQAERYDIGGAVESIYYAGSFKEGVKDIDINLDTRRGGNIHLQVDNDGKVINEYNDSGDIENSPYIGKNLSEILGKELANKVLSLEEEQSLSGDGLRIGGEGMKGFYDKMLPAFMNKYGKKWGVKVEDIELPNLENGLTMHSVPVTEEMKASVMEGQVMFRMRGENESAMDFTQSVVDEYKSQFNELGDLQVVPVNEETAERFGLTLEQLKKKDGHFDPETQIISIFANEDNVDSFEVENTIFHEDIHFIADFYPHMDKLGQWMWENASSNKGFSQLKEAIETSADESEYHQEMLTNMVSVMLSMGATTEFEQLIPEDYRSIVKHIENEIGYDRQAEASRRENRRNSRNSEGATTPSVRDGENTQTSGSESLTAEERRIINEYFPGAFRIVDSKGNTLTLAQEKFFANSKAVDKDGNLLVLYHGTPRAGFTEFKSGWFTTSKEDAISYSGDRKGRLFDPNETFEPETLIAGDYRLGYMTFDSEEDRAEFLERFPYAEEVMPEAEYESARLQADEEYDALTEKRGEFKKVWDAYREYERERFVDSTIADLLESPNAYTEDDFRRALLAYDSNVIFDEVDEIEDASERKDALVAALNNAVEDAKENGADILDMKVATRVPRNGEGVKYNDSNARTYETYINVERPLEIDAAGRHSELESGDIYKAVEEALADDQYDGVIIRNWRVGRHQQLGDVVVPKTGSQVKLTSNQNPTKSSDIRFRTSNNNQIKSATDNTGEFSSENEDIRFSIRTKPAPENTITVYKMVRLGEDGQPYPLFIGSAEPMPVKTWLDADSPNLGDLKKLPSGVHLINTKTGESMTLAEFEEAHPEMKNNSKKATNPTTEAINWATMNGMRFIKIVDKKTKQTRYSGEKRAYYNLGIDGGGSVSMYGMRPGWHAGSHPVMRQIGNGPEKNLRADNHVWVRGRISADVDYQAEANANPGNEIPTHIPTDGYYLKATNANAKASQADRMGWYISGSFIIDEFISDAEARRVIDVWNADHPDKKLEYDFPRESGVEFDPETDPRLNGVSFRVTGTPTEDVVAEGVSLSPAQTAEVAANIFAALPEESRKKITEGLNGNILGLKDAILQIPTSLASKENWNEEDKQMAAVVAEEMTKMAGEMTRPFSAEEGLWLLYNNLNKGTDLVSQASRALVQRNLGFDAETLAKQQQAKEDVRFRTVGDATSNAQASLYNRGAVNAMTRLKESYVDMNASVEELVKAIEKRTGKEAQGFENILLALNQQSSKGLAAMESYTQKFLNPMFDEIRKIMDETKMKYEDVVRYVILKHGLERNKKLAQRDARAHYQEIYDDIISKITGMTAAQKRTYLTNAQLKEGDAKAELATLQAVDMSAMTDEEKREHKKKLAAARKAVEEAEEHLKRAQKIASLSEQEAQDELDKIFEKIENGTDSVFKEMRENDYSGISSMFYDQLGVDRKNFSTEEQYQAALMDAKKDRYSSLKDIEAAAEAEVKSFEGKTDTKELWKRINAATKETLRQQYEANMISKDQYLNLRDMFEYYVPLRGFKDNTAEDMYTYYRKPNSTGYTKPILGAEGRKTEAESPFGWIAAMAGSAIASNVKNEAKLALYYFVSNRPENGIATISKTWFVDSGEVDERGKKIFKPAYPPFSEDLSSAEGKAQYEIWQANMKELQKKGQAYEAGQRLNLGNAVVNISDANKPEHIVNVKVGGKDYTIIINGNPRAAQAINGDLNIEGTAQDYSALFGPVLRWMSSVNTSYNPEFWITNMMRDMAFTMMAVNIKEDPAYRRKFSKNYRKAFKVVSLVAKNEKGTIGDSYLEQQYKDFVKYGGVTGYTQIKDSETWEHEIENYLSSSDPESLKSGKVMRGMKSAFHAAHRFGESLEQVSRFAAFLTARETGKSINEAIDDAKEITVNFNRKGSGKMITLEEAKYLTGKNGQPLTKPQQWMVVGLSSIAPLGRRFIMFFNAAIQGLNATYKLMKKNPKRFTGWALGYAAVGMMNAVLHAMLDDDDDYLDIPQYERRNSLMIGGNGAYFKWALPQEARAFYALGDLAVETVMGRNPHQNVLGEALKIGTEILPVNPSEGWKAFMPSVAIPLIELALNEDYKGAPIYNEQKWLSEEEKERTAKWSNAYQGTGWTYVKIAQGLNFITGGDKHDAGLINLQPEKLEHLVQSAFGGTIRTADKFINTISAALDPEEPMTIRQTPFLNRFLTINDERFKNVHVNDVFDYYKADAEHALTLEKRYIKDRDMDSLTKLRSSDEYQWAKIYGKYKKPLKAIQDKIKVADGTAEKKELMKQQDELKKRMIKEISEL